MPLGYPGAIVAQVGNSLDMPKRTCLWAAILLILLASAAAAQQQSAVVRGQVAGADRQPIAGASVTLLDQLGTPIGFTLTDSAGQFRMRDIPPGTYTLFAEAPPQRSDARVVTVQAALPVVVELTLAARTSESVVVSAATEAPPVTTRMTIAGDTLRQVPTRILSRAVQQVLATLPGWSSEDDGLLHVRGVDDGFLYVEDGLPVYDRMDTLFGIAPDAASIGTVNVLTGYIPPEYGLKSGAVIEVQSSSSARPGWAADVDTGFGSDAARSLRGVGGGPLGGRASLGLSVASERSNRFLEPVHPDNFHNEGGVLSGEMHLNVLGGDTDLVKINLTGGRSRYQVPHGEIQEEVGQDQRQRLIQNSQSGSWQRFWSDAVVSQVSAYRRHINASLRSSPADTPLSATSDRQQDRLGALGGVTYEHGRHTMKIGGEMSRLAIREDFRFAVTNPEAAEVSDSAALFTDSHPFLFADRVSRPQWSFYAQDRVRATERLTMDFGARFDRTNLLVAASQWSPRVGVAYAPTASTTLRASVNRLFQPPQPEHLLLASSPAARALSPFESGDGDANSGGAALEPERQTAWELGLDHWFRGVARLDAAYWSRHVRNYADPNVFFGTTIIFPNSVARGTARGLDLRFEVPRYRSFSSYVSYTLSKVEQVGPINGGLFLEDNVLEIGPGTHFTPDHDQRHVAAAGLTYQNAARRLSAAIAARYESGTPLEVDETDVSALHQRPGAALVDFDSDRVAARTILDFTVSKTVHRATHTETSVRVGILNATNESYALNFGNPFSGTHFGAPRTVRVDLRIGLQ